MANGLTGKADKIWALFPAGNSRSEIAGFLGIRYQRVRNVLVRCGIVQTQLGRPMPTEDVSAVGGGAGVAGGDGGSGVGRVGCWSRGPVDSGLKRRHQACQGYHLEHTCLSDIL